MMQKTFSRALDAVMSEILDRAGFWLLPTNRELICVPFKSAIGAQLRRKLRRPGHEEY